LNVLLFKQPHWWLTLITQAKGKWMPQFATKKQGIAAAQPLMLLLCVSILVWPLCGKFTGHAASSHPHPKSPLILVQDDAPSRRCTACAHTARVNPSDPPLDLAALLFAAPVLALRPSINASPRVVRFLAPRFLCALCYRAPPSIA
jgi:hypothetical protein